VGGKGKDYHPLSEPKCLFKFSRGRIGRNPKGCRGKREGRVFTYGGPE